MTAMTVGLKMCIRDSPCTMANVAANMGISPTNRISTFRAQLIAKGLIYATGYGEVDFTVPKFDEFIKRTLPDKF